MKKITALILSIVLVMALFTGCSSSSSKALKTGIGVVSSTDHSSKDAEDEDGLAQTDSTVAAVLVDDKGVIKQVSIDMVQTKINFSNTGEITTDPDATFQTKQELGFEYNMKDASPIGKEWFEQAEAFEKYITGKTLEEVKGIALEGGKATDEDLVSSVTISIGDLIAAVEKAVNNAKDLGAKESDKLGLGVVAAIGSKTANAEDGDGVAQAYSHYAAVTLDKDGKITSSMIDASQSDVNFSKEGKLTKVGAADAYQTKNELGDGYEMKEASSIGKEWFEQAEGFSKYITGKTIEEVKGISLEGGKPTDEDLLSSVTIAISDCIQVVERRSVAIFLVWSENVEKNIYINNLGTFYYYYSHFL